MDIFKTPRRGAWALGGAPALISLAIAAAPANAATLGTLTQISGSDPFAACTADSSNNPGTNYPNTTIEPWIDVNPTNPLNIVAGWQQDRWDNGGSRSLVSAYSTDGGLSWTQVPIPNITLCAPGQPGQQPTGTYQRATDPWLSFAPDGTLYFMSQVLDIAVQANRPAGFGPNGMMVSRSTDGGKTWSDPISLIASTDPRLLNDKVSITADPGDSHFVYGVWDQLKIPVGQAIAPEDVSPAAGKAVALGLLAGFGYTGPTFFSRTTDSGTTWETAHAIYNPGANNQTIGNQILVLPNGTLINFFDEILSFKTNNSQGVHSTFNLSLIRSFDKGATWQTKPAPIRAQQILCNGAVIPNTSVSDRVIRDGCILFDVAVDKSNGHLYAVWQDNRFNSAPNQVDQVAFSQSTNGGQTWTTPIKVNQTPDNDNPLLEQAFLPSVAVDSNGVLVVTYYDFRNDNTNTAVASTDYFEVTCDPGSTDCSNATNWVPSNELRLTSSSFDLALAPEAPASRGHFLGDYMGLAADADGSVFPAFGQVTNTPSGTTGFNTTTISTRQITP